MAAVIVVMGAQAAVAAAGPVAMETSSTTQSICRIGFVELSPRTLWEAVDADGTTTYRLELINGTGQDATFDLTYSITTGNAAMVGPATLWVAASDDGVLFDVHVTPMPGLPHGTSILGSIGASGAGYSCSSSVSLGVVTPPEILHHWSFTTDGTDSVGGAHASLYGDATTTGGALVLDGDGDYAYLPIAATLQSLTDVSVEAWVIWRSARSWERIFDFGTGTTVNWFMTTRASDSLMPRVAITTGGGSGEERTDSWRQFPASRRTHVVFTLWCDGESAQSKLYLNGSRVGYSVTSGLNPADLSALASLTNTWLGRSQYAADPDFLGEIDEFIIHRGVLTDLPVLQRYRDIFADGFDGGDTIRWSTTHP